MASSEDQSVKTQTDELSCTGTSAHARGTQYFVTPVQSTSFDNTPIDHPIESNPKHTLIHNFYKSMISFFSQCMNAFSRPNLDKVSNVRIRQQTPILLEGCDTQESHLDRIEASLTTVATLHGAEGLAAIGFVYRFIPCAAHNPRAADNPFQNGTADDNSLPEQPCAISNICNNTLRTSASATWSVSRTLDELDVMSTATDHSGTKSSSRADLSAIDGGGGDRASMSSVPASHCNFCTNSLCFNTTTVKNTNRCKFIADGHMYEAVCRLAQEHAQSVMIEECNLTWITIADGTKGCEDVRMLISIDHPMICKSTSKNNRPSILICTGRGKVRTGVFSRHHILCTCIEMATALPIVREAFRRRLNIVLFDPNVHGEKLGFVTFQKSMNFLRPYFEDADPQNDTSHSRHIYVLAHSASGGHLVRYFLDSDESNFFKSLKAIVFTDSTHNIQWCKSYEKKNLFRFLQSTHCVYFRCARNSDGVAGDGNKWYLHPAGEPGKTDTFWQHRFGKIKTMWAGTNDHSLINWYTLDMMWEHFDDSLYACKFVAHLNEENAG